MPFTTDMAGLVANQLTRFVTLNRHQLAGQVENLDFWMTEVRHALDVIDGYGIRFVRLHAAQERYVAVHNVTTSEIRPAGVTERRPPPAVRRVPDRELQRARRALVMAATQFLERCRAEGLLSAGQLSAVLARLAMEQRRA